ncbi:hypothetical protein ABZW02_31685 [Streptomyces sp. NPDC005180]|uniref:hypothetical protein n=1 Tax=Streptomyces sp. NPDC005180 TaxID=3156868 RepID=UPI0033B76FEC
MRTREDLARDRGMSFGTFRNRKLYAVPGHPAPISSVGARVLLWDAEQTDAFRDGRPVPALPPPGDNEDLLDRNEAAAELGVTPKSWDSYQRAAPELAEQRVVVAGVEHWPRRAVVAFKQARPGKRAATGRPAGSGDAVPRAELAARVEALLERDPAVTTAQVMDDLGVSYSTAQKALVRLRGARIAELMKTDPGLQADEAAGTLGYPPAVRRAAVAEAERQAGTPRPDSRPTALSG